MGKVMDFRKAVYFLTHLGICVRPCFGRYSVYQTNGVPEILDSMEDVVSFALDRGLNLDKRLCDRA